ncbi:DUF3883 domain-containing protein [Candidatus Electronema sp. JM]|uniref:DUF3883 domain-containing protein n=1 Tax=Candidatus Electronema sp. JM TaxID=3401571 RepID=UPI003AA931DC
MLFENEAEDFVYQFEIDKGRLPEKAKENPGYDFLSKDAASGGERHIEVKWKKKRGSSWLQLTANETEAMQRDRDYFLYLVEGESEPFDLYLIPQADLLDMAQLKVHARLTRLSNKEKRKSWSATNQR